MARELVPVDKSSPFAFAPDSAQQDADFADVGRREILRRFALGAVLAAIGVPSWLRAGQQNGLSSLAASSSPLVPLSSGGEIRGAYATKSILAIISGASGALSGVVGILVGVESAALIANPVLGAVLGIVGAIVGLIGALVGIFWNPSPGQEADTIWNLIKAKVQNLINVSITDAEFSALNGAINGLKNNMLDYIALVKQHKQLKSAQSLSELRQKYIAVDAYCISVRPQFLPAGSESRFLVLFAQFANLHHILLQDMVLNGKAYGVEPGVVANDVEKLAQTIAQNCATFDHFWSEFVGNCDQSRGDSSMGADHVANHSGLHGTYYSWVENALYYRNRDVANSIAQVTALAKDYRDLWPYMGALQRGPASLTRELWFGPFGAPDCFEFGGDFTTINNGYKLRPLSIPWAYTGGYRAALKPPNSPTTPLQWLSVSTFDAPAPQFPTGLQTGKDGSAPPQDGFVIVTSDDHGGPITGVSVMLGQYNTAMGSSNIPVAGRVVNQITLTQTNSQNVQKPSTVGEQFDFGVWGTYPGDGDQFVTMSVDVPDAHILSGISNTSWVTRLYNTDNYYMQNQDDDVVNVLAGHRSFGSMMFGFRLQDPTLAPDAATLAAIQAANPELPPLGADAAVAVVASVRKAHGQVVSAQEKAILRAKFARELTDPALAVRSAAFQRMVDDRLVKLKAAGSN